MSRKPHKADWITARKMLQQVFDKYAESIGRMTAYRKLGHQLGEVSTKTVQRDITGIKPIPMSRLETWFLWLCQESDWDDAQLHWWVECSGHPRPRELLNKAPTTDPVSEGEILSNSIPRPQLYGEFLGRDKEIRIVRDWLNETTRKVSIAVLLGPGGNGKTTIQLKVAEMILENRIRGLSWSFEAVIWLTAETGSRSEGKPSLDDVLREVLKVYEGLDDELQNLAPTRVRKQAEALLENKRTLILLDSFERVSRENRQEILDFFGRKQRKCQVLISSRYEPTVEFELSIRPAYQVILVKGLTTTQAETLVRDYADICGYQLSHLGSVEEIAALLRVTRKNPKAIILALGLVHRKWASLRELVRDVRKSKPKADEIFDVIMGKAWRDLLPAPARGLLMAKGLFRQPVNYEVLGRVAGIEDRDVVVENVSFLRDISFFERIQERPIRGDADTRVTTHPLAQAFSRRVFLDRSNAESGHIEESWWRYAEELAEEVRSSTYRRADAELLDNMISVIDWLRIHIEERTSHALRAIELFAGPRYGLGYVLRQWGKWDEVVRVARIAFPYAVECGDPVLIARCGLDFLSWVYRERQELSRALQWVDRVADANRDLGNDWLVGSIKQEQAWIIRRQKDLSGSKALLEQSLKRFDIENHKEGISSTYIHLGGIMVDMALDDFEESVDTKGQLRVQMSEAKEYFALAQRFYDGSPHFDPKYRFDNVSIQAWGGVIARVEGDQDHAFDLFYGCLDQFQSMNSEGRLRRELALVEYLRGNYVQAQKLEEDGLRILQQLASIDRLFQYNCYRVINRLKQQGLWGHGS